MKPEVQLRPSEFSDRKTLAKLANNRKIWNNLLDRMPYPYTEKDAEEFIAFTKTEKPTQHFVIEYAGSAVGMIGLEIQEDVFRKTAQLGYWIGEPYWGKGIVTQAVGLMCNYGFEKLDIVRIQAGVFDFNLASQRVLEKNLFEKEAVLKNACIKNGSICDNILYVKLQYKIADVRL